MFVNCFSFSTTGFYFKQLPVKYDHIQKLSFYKFTEFKFCQSGCVGAGLYPLARAGCEIFKKFLSQLDHSIVGSLKVAIAGMFTP